MSRSRPDREFIEDLELRLAPSHLSKRARLVNCVRDFPPNFITINDNDDDVEIFFGRPPREPIRFFPHPDSWVPVITEEDLELRLGPRAPLRYSRHSSGGIDVSEDCLRGSHYQKYGKASCSHLDSKEVRLKCAICVDIMKEETSTVCGHLFCKPCITSAILAQKRCPVCRLKLSISNIHPVYLPEAIS